MSWNDFLNNISDKETDDDSIKPSLSPLDFIPYTGLADAAISAGSDAIKAAPQVLSNEIGAIGRDVSPEVPSKLADYLTQKSTADATADAANNGTADLTDVIKSQQNMSRAADFADRAKSQKFLKINKVLGR